MNLSGKSALIVIDMQVAIDDPRWGARNNPNAEQNVLDLLGVWRREARPVIHVRYESKEPGSSFRGAGVEFKACARPQVDEKVITKPGASAFVGTDLLGHLIREGIDTVVIVGVITNNSVEATARMSGELGFRTLVVSDATFTFGRTDYGGHFRDAQLVHDLSLSNLQGQYAEIVSTADLLAS